MSLFQMTKNYTGPNEYIDCACGFCNEKIPKYDKEGRLRKYANYHYTIMIKHLKEKKRLANLVKCGCGKCDKWIPKYDKKNRIRTYFNGHAKIGKRIPNSKNWRIHGGYKEIYKPDHYKAIKKGYVREHLLVYEEYYKCCLTKWGVIHHKDHNKLNNDISNLQPLMWYEHPPLHHKGNTYKRKDMSNWFCIICGSKTTYVKKDGRSKWFNFNGKDDSEGHVCQSCQHKRKKLEKKKKPIYSISLQEFL